MRKLVVVGLVAIFGCSKGKPAAGPIGMTDPLERLAGVPGQTFAVGVLELGTPPMKTIGVLLDEKAAAEMLADLDGYLRKQLGVSLGKARSITIFGSPQSGAALIPYVEGTLAGPGEGEHMGVKLHAAMGGMVAAQSHGLLVIGDKDPVIAALDVLEGRAASLASASPELAELFAREAKGATAVLMLSGNALAMLVQERGLDAGIVTVRAAGVRALIRGDEPQLKAVAAKLEAGIGVLVGQLASAPPPEDAVVEHAAYIVTKHHVDYFKRVFAPKVAGGSLTLELPLRGEEVVSAYMFTAMVGILAAVAIPAFMKNARKSKLSEATVNLERLYEAARRYHGDKHAFPPGSAGPTPPLGACCAQAGKKCAPDPKLWTGSPWKELQFQMDDPGYFSYTYASDGASFTVTAHGDLDCDGVYSTFELVGSTQGGQVTDGAGIYRENELE